MKVTFAEKMRIAYQAEQLRLQTARDQQYRTSLERKKFEKVVEDRIARARRLGLDKGRNVDIDC